EAGEIHSRLLDHRPVIQGEIRYFIKEFEEKRGLRELRVLENLKHTMSETKEHSLPKCEQAMRDNLNETFKRCKQVASYFSCCAVLKNNGLWILASRLMCREEERAAQWETFMKEQETKRAEVDEEHRKAMQRLKEQYANMEKELAKYVSF
ncbi:BL1S5 protein, partial [Nothoprocta ornata]|nr:BL1S5 protein [Nothoprocta ornata]